MVTESDLNSLERRGMQDIINMEKNAISDCLAGAYA